MKNKFLVKLFSAVLILSMIINVMVFAENNETVHPLEYLDSDTKIVLATPYTVAF